MIIEAILKEISLSLNLITGFILYFLVVQLLLFVKYIQYEYKAKKVANLWKREQERFFAELKLGETQKRFIEEYSQGLTMQEAYSKIYERMNNEN